jgi:hydroxymethylpyrimidine pyrophosphatase-like HAD family hydrolase
MHYLALAVDYDGTIAHDGTVDDATQQALRRLRAGARRLLLVTGRELPDLQRVMPALDLFDLVVAENGALLFDPATGEATPLAQPPPEPFVARLREMGIAPLSVGTSIVATWEPNETAVLEVIREQGLDLQITFNKGAVMVLPGGVTKASGLLAALEMLELSPLNCVGIGDAENDLAFLDACGLAVAVENALPSVKSRVALVTNGARGAGVAELIDRILASDLVELDAGSGAPHVALARELAGDMAGGGGELAYAPQRASLLITGESGAGKSTLVLGLLERIAARGFQWCVLDPEGDYEGIGGAVSEGTAEAAPDPAHVLDLLRKTARGVVASMLALPIADRPAFLARLLPEILALRARVGRPHVVVVDEAHHMLSRDWDPGGAQVPAELEGFVFVTTTPDQVSPRVLACVNHLLVVGHDAARAVAAFCRARGLPEPSGVPDLGPGSGLRPDHRPGAAHGNDPRHRRTPSPSAEIRRGQAGRGHQLLVPRPRGQAEPARPQPHPVPRHGRRRGCGNLGVPPPPGRLFRLDARPGQRRRPRRRGGRSGKRHVQRGRGASPGARGSGAAVYGAGVRQESAFFFEKKNQKTSIRLSLARDTGPAQNGQSLFASFSSEKEDSFFPAPRGLASRLQRRGTKLRIAVGIVTTGRAAILAETVAELRRQARRPDRLIVCGAAREDLAGLNPAEAELLAAPRGMTQQRNAVLRAAADCDLLVFFDDDFLPAPGWLAAAEAMFAAHPDVVVATGTVVADGGKGPGLSPEEGRRLLHADPGGTAALVPVHNAYGCNMALRLDTLRAHGLFFDVALPLYAWFEDVDLSRRAARHGRVVRMAEARGVHLATKQGRTSGLRYGYSQISNPIYLARKGSLGWGRALHGMAKHLAINLARAPVPEPWVDRRGRLRGNLIALADLVRGRADPDRILSL